MGKNIFEKVKMNKPKRSAFDLSHEVKTSATWGTLNPIMCEEVVPGDQFSVNSELLVRMAPTIAPVMHRIDVYVHHFYVPNRIIDSNWEEFIFPKDVPDVPPPLPKITITSTTPANVTDDKSLWSRFGLPSFDPAVLAEDLQVNALPFMAYNAIYNEYYRDQNLVDEVSAINTGLLTRAWEKDYFTSCLPWAQKSASPVQIPVGGLEVNYKNPANVIPAVQQPLPQDLAYTASGDFIDNADPTNFLGIDNISNLGDAEINIEDLRRGARLQEWLERAARGGTRYKEALLSFFGVSAGDGRLDRPEYLGGGKQAITISEVLNSTGITAQSGNEGGPVGDMSGHGIAVGAKNQFKYSVKEHGYIISLLSILPHTSYQQGIDRHWRYQDRFDYYWKEFANIGEQEVANEELYFNPQNTGANETTFGYQQRYAHYKYKSNQTTGDMRGTLDFWHVGRIFDVLPTLNETFITPTEQDDLDRIFAVDAKTTGADQFWVQVYNSVKARRPMPYFSNPTL